MIFMTRVTKYSRSDVDRTFPGMRWTNIVLRTVHLCGNAGVGGAFLYDVPVQQWTPFLGLTVVSGSVLMLLAVWSNGLWFVQLRGVATVVKLVLLTVGLVAGMNVVILFSVIAISGIISHAPGKIRYYRVFGG
jgi:hypothetical protein